MCVARLTMTATYNYFYFIYFVKVFEGKFINLKRKISLNNICLKFRQNEVVVYRWNYLKIIKGHKDGKRVNNKFHEWC